MIWRTGVIKYKLTGIMLYWYSISCQGSVRSFLAKKKIELCINDRNKTPSPPEKPTKQNKQKIPNKPHTPPTNNKTNQTNQNSNNKNPKQKKTQQIKIFLSSQKKTYMSVLFDPMGSVAGLGRTSGSPLPGLLPWHEHHSYSFTMQSRQFTREYAGACGFLPQLPGL